MTSHTYTAIDAHGLRKTGQIEAADIRQASAALRSQGLFPVRLARTTAPAIAGPKPAGKPAGRSWRGRGRNFELRLPFSRVVGGKELAGFTRQLATLLRAGMPLLRGLEVLARQERKPAFRQVIESLGEAVRTGGTLSEGMARHAAVFDPLYRNMVKAGEAGGALDAVLERIAHFQEKRMRLKGKIAAAMFYPLVVMGVAVFILAGLLVFVVPRFKQIFAELLRGAPLPALTQFVLTLSDAVRENYIVVGAGVAIVWMGMRAAGKRPRGARLIDAALIRLPLFGELVLKGVVARFGRTFGTLLSSGVPMLPALLITRDICGNRRVAEAVMTVHDCVKEGEPVARSLEATQVFPPMVASMIEVGEHTGQLPGMLGKVAEIYEDEVDDAVAGLSSLIEPLLIVFLAVVVGTIVIALFLPIVRVVQLLT